ncbi:MAG: hypothetical protein MUE69_27045 [Myxococcota bacterium]|jgi:hypothetical protein|nr:hypothetical protein [Myxococcota bacterium]
MRRAMLFAWILGCGGTGDGPPPEQRWFEGSFEGACTTETGRALFECGDDAAWDALQWRHEERGAAIDALSTAIDRASADPELDEEDRAKLLWRRVQLAVALVAENNDGSRVASSSADIDRAARLVPDDFRIAGWKALFDMLITYQTRPEEFPAARARIDELFELAPDYTLPVVMGTAMALPLDTGYPQEMARRVEEFDCASFDWCMRATSRVPFQQAGIELLFAEIHARVGDRELARVHLERSLSAPRAEHWPYRFVAEEKLADLDGWLATFAARGESESVLDITENNGRRACVICHGPPSAPVRD